MAFLCKDRSRSRSGVVLSTHTQERRVRSGHHGSLAVVPELAVPALPSLAIPRLACQVASNRLAEVVRRC